MKKQSSSRKKIKVHKKAIKEKVNTLEEEEEEKEKEVDMVVAEEEETTQIEIATKEMDHQDMIVTTLSIAKKNN